MRPMINWIKRDRGRMEVNNKVHHSSEQWDALARASDDGPVCMINLFKFKNKAEYTDGRDSQLTGIEAYEIYSNKTRKMVQEAGGRILHTSVIKGLVVGEVEQLWDVVAIVEYPSIEVFMKMVDSEEWKENIIHKDAGLEGQLNIFSKVP